MQSPGRVSLGLCSLLLAVSRSSIAVADEPLPEGPPGAYARPPDDLPPRTAPRRRTISDTYAQFTMGFIAGARNYRRATFESRNNVAAALLQPFERLPYNGVDVYGLRYELRIAVSYLRGTIGVDIPFPDFAARDTTGTYMLDGTDHPVSVQALRPYELRFGIGGEYPIWVFAPFVDLVGYTHWTDTALAFDDQKAEYRAQGFGFAVRGGVRIHAREWFFVELAGEAGLYGPVLWNAGLSLGFAVPRTRD